MCAHAGLGYASFSKFSTLFFGDTFMPSKGMWTRISQRVAGAMVDVANVSMERARQLVAAAFLKSGKLATIAMDMGWSTRGWHARFGSMPIIVSGFDVIIDHIVLCKTSTVGDTLKMQGNYMGSSKGMEGRAVNLTTHTRAPARKHEQHARALSVSPSLCIYRYPPIPLTNAHTHTHTNLCAFTQSNPES